MVLRSEEARGGQSRGGTEGRGAEGKNWLQNWLDKFWSVDDKWLRALELCVQKLILLKSLITLSIPRLGWAAAQFKQWMTMNNLDA